MTLLLLALYRFTPAQAAEPVGAAVSVAVAPDRLGQYDAIRLALVSDQLDATKAAATTLAAASTADPEVAAAASAVAAAPDLAGARAAFGELSRLLLSRLGAQGGGPKVIVYHCPMFAGFAWWVQPKSGIANPYMGQAMPGCGEETSLKAAVKAAAVR